MHLFLHRPHPAVIQLFIQQQALLAFSYPQVGLTQHEPVSLAGFRVDHYEVQVGHGAAAFAAAQAAVRRWAMFDQGWLQACWPTAPIVPGSTVAVLAHAYGLWFLNACRIVYTIAEAHRFGFAYGTLPGHAERGEERFVVQLRPDETVWYEVLAVSRPHAWAWPGYPLVRRLQRRFGRDTRLAMQKAVER